MNYGRQRNASARELIEEKENAWSFARFPARQKDEAFEIVFNPHSTRGGDFHLLLLHEHKLASFFKLPGAEAIKI